MTENRQVTESAVSALTERMSTSALFEALGLLAGDDLTDDERVARSWIRGVLEERYDVCDALDAWADDALDVRGYDEALRAAVAVVAPQEVSVDC